MFLFKNKQKKLKFLCWPLHCTIAGLGYLLDSFNAWGQCITYLQLNLEQKSISQSESFNYIFGSEQLSKECSPSFLSPLNERMSHSDVTCFCLTSRIH